MTFHNERRREAKRGFGDSAVEEGAQRQRMALLGQLGGARTT